MDRIRRLFIVLSTTVAIAVSFVTVGHAAGPVFKLVGGGCYFADETLRIAVSATPGTTDNVGDLYVVLKTPDGNYYSYKKWNAPNVLTPLIPSWTVQPLNAVSIKVPLSTLPTTMVGRYKFMIGTMKPGTRTVTSNVGRMVFYIKEVGNVPAACQCPGNQWSLYTDTFYAKTSPPEVTLSLEGTVPLTLSGSDLAGTVSGTGTVVYRNVYSVAECEVDVGGDWTASVDGGYQSETFSLTMTTTPSLVTGTITCGGVTQPFPPFVPPTPPAGASQSYTMPMSPGYSFCEPVRVSGMTGYSCQALSCR